MSKSDSKSQFDRFLDEWSRRDFLRGMGGALAFAAFAAGGAEFLAACGVPRDHEPRQIDARNVPFSLLAPTAGATSTTTPLGPSPMAQVTIYLADADGIQANSDLYASGEYRAHLARVYTRRALEEAVERASGK